MKILKKKILLGAPAVALPLVSLQAFLGALLGYFLARLTAGRVRSLAFNIGSYRLHLHHWLFGSLILAPSFYYNFLPWDKFAWGFLGGLIFQGIYSYSDWHKILTRRKRS